MVDVFRFKATVLKATVLKARALKAFISANLDVYSLNSY